ncbi:MAG: signal peptidase II [Planctomycetes bacterium]|nr:signal peptidase II [Planctomycetota bacterium]
MSEAAAAKPQAPSAKPNFLSQAVGQKVIFWAVLLVSLIADIASKAWADITLRPFGDKVVPVIPNVLAWKWAENKGAAFSILDGRADILSIIAAVVLLAVFVYMVRTKPERKIFLIALGMVAAGAMGNLYDRILLGHVRDFIFFDFDLPLHEKFSFIPQRWPVFNVADMSILGGVGTLVVLSLFTKEKKVEKQAKS